jgi:hypothetical protein
MASFSDICFCKFFFLSVSSVPFVLYFSSFPRLYPAVEEHVATGSMSGFPSKTAFMALKKSQSFLLFPVLLLCSLTDLYIFFKDELE